jgi:hypothetical protein
MRRTISILLALAALASPLAAQAHPDFSGKWALDPKTAPPNMPAGMSMVLDVKQDEKTMTVELSVTGSMDMEKRKTALNLDGSPTKNSVATPAGTIEMTSTAVWDAKVLAVTTSGDLGGTPVVQSDRWSLEPDGKSLTLETTVSAAGQKATTKLTFLKQ